MKKQVFLFLCLASLLASCSRSHQSAHQAEASVDSSNDTDDDARAIVIDDMVFSPENLRAPPGEDAEFHTEAARGKWYMFSRTWKKGLIPIKFDFDATPEQEALLYEACSEWSKVANIKCVPYDNQGDYLHIRNKTSKGCRSTIGLQGAFFMKDVMNLKGSCWVKGTIMHEFGHTIGLVHEHQRSDRDDYLIFHRKNMRSGSWSNLTMKWGGKNLTPYDFESIMHYSGTAFAKEKGLYTMEPKPGYEEFKEVMGQRLYLSDGDAAAAQALYGPPVQ